MKYSMPTELTDTMVRETDRIARGDRLTIDILAAEVECRKTKWLDLHPGWTFTGTNLIPCADHTPSPSYDVVLGFRRPRTKAELEAQEQERNAYISQREALFHQREEAQRALLEEVLASLKR